jgi:hypothetical protein
MSTTADWLDFKQCRVHQAPGSVLLRELLLEARGTHDDAPAREAVLSSAR